MTEASWQRAEFAKSMEHGAWSKKIEDRRQRTDDRGQLAVNY
jgi:hypothetical protein